jgi:hypothetical protein
MAEQMRTELKSIDINGIWLNKKRGIKQPNGFSNEDYQTINDIIARIDKLII